MSQVSILEYFLSNITSKLSNDLIVGIRHRDLPLKSL
jgi:hypothetical protein